LTTATVTVSVILLLVTVLAAPDGQDQHAPTLRALLSIATVTVNVFLTTTAITPSVGVMETTPELDVKMSIVTLTVAALVLASTSNVIATPTILESRARFLSALICAPAMVSAHSSLRFITVSKLTLARVVAQKVAFVTQAGPVKTVALVPANPWIVGTVVTVLLVRRESPSASVTLNIGEMSANTTRAMSIVVSTATVLIWLVFVMNTGTLMRLDYALFPSATKSVKAPVRSVVSTKPTMSPLVSARRVSSVRTATWQPAPWAALITESVLTESVFATIITWVMTVS